MSRLLPVGIGGAILTALCCFTPLLPWALGVFGLSSIVGYVYRDAVLLPILLAFLALIVLAIWRKRNKASR